MGGFMKQLLFLLTIAFSFQATAERVPAIFTGDSPAPAYKDFAKFRYKKDSRSSEDFAEYHLDTSIIDTIRLSEGIQLVHTHVRNIAKDDLCGDYGQCFRVYVFINGDEDTGEHVATFVVSPGTGRRTPRLIDAPLRKYNPNVRWLYKFEKPTKFKNYDMYRIYGSKSYPGSIPNMPNAMFFTPPIAIHGSFDTVNGTKQSHGCVRMFPDESYWLHSLVREAGGNLTTDIHHTR